MRRVIPLAALLVCAGIAVAVAAPGLGANQAVIMKYVDIWNKGDMALADDVLTASVQRVGPDVRFSPSGIAAVKAYIAESRETYPDLKVTINRLESDADRVIMNWTFRGTYAGTEFPEAAGVKVKSSGTSIYRVIGGKVAEERVSWDVLGVYHQLGVDPPEAQTRRNIALFRRFIHELYERGNLDAAYEIVAEDHLFHVPVGSAYRHGRDGVQKRATMFPLNLLGGRSRIEYQPLGVVGVISPWNFPVNLTFGPLAGILAAGNRAMIKPSEFTPATSAVMAEMVKDAWDEKEVAIFDGGPEVGQAFSGLAFDHLLFTGATSIAKHIMAAAARNLVPVTLELGGKSPVIISRSADIEKSVSRIMVGKTLNAGQICLAPDYLMVPEEKLHEVIASRMIDYTVAKRIVKTAKVVARLYVLRLEELDNI